MKGICAAKKSSTEKHVLRVCVCTVLTAFEAATTLCGEKDEASTGGADADGEEATSMAAFGLQDWETLSSMDDAEEVSMQLVTDTKKLLGIQQRFQENIHISVKVSVDGFRECSGHPDKSRIISC